MKFLLALIALFAVAPAACIRGGIGFVDSRATYTAVPLGAFSTASDEPKYVTLEGFLLRQLPPNGVLGDNRYWFPLVDEETARAALAAGTYRSPTTGPLLFARAHGKELPVEAFFAPSSGKKPVVAVPITIEGKRRSGLELPLRVAATFGVEPDRDVRVVDVAHEDMSPAGQLITIALGVLAFLWAVSYLRKWRRRRRAEKEQLKVHVEERLARVEAKRLRDALDQPPPRAATSEGRVNPEPVPGGGGGFSIPMKPIIGGLIVLGIAGAKLGSKVAPKLDDVARGVAKSADHIADGAGTAIAKSADEVTPRIELPSAGEVLLDGVGHAQTAAGVGQTLQGTDSGEEVPKGRSSSGRTRLTVTTLEFEETYRPMEASVGSSALRFELAKTREVARMEGTINGIGPLDTTDTSTDLPERSKGEFTRVTLIPTGTGVRLVHEFAVSLESGYVTVFEAAGDLEFVGGGSFDELATGARAITLALTPAGALEYIEGVGRAMGRVMEYGLGKVGFRVKDLEVTYVTPPVEEIILEGGRLNVRQRGQSEVLIIGRH